MNDGTKVLLTLLLLAGFVFWFEVYLRPKLNRLYWRGRGSIAHRIRHWLGLAPCRIVRVQNPGDHEWLFLECVVCGKTEEYAHSAVCEVCENMGTIQYENRKTCGNVNLECVCPTNQRGDRPQE